MTTTLHLQAKNGSPGRSAPPATTGVPGLNRFKCRVVLASASPEYYIFCIFFRTC